MISYLFKDSNLNNDINSSRKLNFINAYVKFKPNYYHFLYFFIKFNYVYYYKFQDNSNFKRITKENSSIFKYL